MENCAYLRKNPGYAPGVVRAKILQPSPQATDFHIAVKIIIEHKFVSFSDGGSCRLPAFFEDRHGFWSDIRRSQEQTEHFSTTSESSIKKFQPARDWKLITLLQSSLFLGPSFLPPGEKKREPENQAVYLCSRYLGRLATT